MRVTSIILILVAFQLALTGLHELSEAQWLPSSKAEMAVIGPVVRNELFFFVLIFGAAALLVLREWQSASHARAAKETAGEAEKRLVEAQNRRQRRWMIAAAAGCLSVILLLTGRLRLYARECCAAFGAGHRCRRQRSAHSRERSAGRQDALVHD